MVGVRPSGEAAAVLTLFTRDLGLIQVTARGIRFERSKLRYHVQLYNFAEVTLVPGKEYYVLIGAVHSQRCKGANIRSLAHVSTLLSRFLGEYDPHPELYDGIMALLEGGEHRELDTALSLRTLELLGYIAREPEDLREAGLLIDQAIRESHL